MIHYPASTGLLVAALTAGLAAAGCGRVERGTVAGTVTVDGAPLKMGFLMLEPRDGSGPQAAAPVRDGRFAVGGSAGIAPGEYLVRVVAPDLAHCDPAASPTPDDPNTFVPMLATPWNDTSAVTVAVAAGMNRLDLAGPRAGPPAPAR
jgi:hypothetical protein